MVVAPPGAAMKRNYSRGLRSASVERLVGNGPQIPDPGSLLIFFLHSCRVSPCSGGNPGEGLSKGAHLMYKQL